MIRRSLVTADPATVAQYVGEGGAIAATLVIVGLLAFAVLVHRGRRQEIDSMLRMCGVAGLVAVAGGALDLASLSWSIGIGWADLITRQLGTATLLRVVGGLLVALGLLAHVVPMGHARREFVADESGAWRWHPSSESALAMVGAAALIVSFSYDGHTVTRGPRVIHALVDAVHVGAASIWTGGVLGLLLIAHSRRRAEGAPSFLGLVVRFSSVATAALIAVAAAGVAMTAMIIDGPRELSSTAWGRRLLVKLVAVAAAVLIGAYNRFVLLRRIDSAPGDPDVERTARQALAAEAAAMVAIACATIWLVNGVTT